MIRRLVGDKFFLIAQNDHAILAGEFARHVGNNHFSRMSPQGIEGTRLHDCGWPLHDENPTINSKRLPIDVFESTQEIALKVWTASADRAMAVNPYVGLLVSIHVLALSAYATGPSPAQNTKFDVSQMTAKFALNKFQHNQIERQEKLRKQLGMRIDIPLKFGLAQSAGIDPREDQLLSDVRLLQAMDLISLAACCTQPPVPRTHDIYPRSGATPVQLQLRRINQTDISVDPWPFDIANLRFEIPYRELDATTFPSNQSLAAAYNSAPTERLSFSLCPA